MPLTPKELTWLGMAKETTWGTAVAPTFYLPHKDVKVEDAIDTINDEGIRGAMAQIYNVLQGPKQSNVQIDGEVFPDTIGLLLMAMLGSDTITGTTPNFIHLFKLARTAQPPSLTHSRYDGTNMRQFAGHIAEELTMKWAEKGDLEFSFKSQGKSSAVATTATPTFTTAIPIQNWNFSCTLGGTANLNLIGFDISMKRKLRVFHAANASQDATSVIAQGLDVTGKATFTKVDDAELSDFLNNTQPIMVLNGNLGVNLGITITMSKCAFIKDPVTAKEVVQGDVEFKCVDNTIDGGPVQVQLKNAVPTY